MDSSRPPLSGQPSSSSPQLASRRPLNPLHAPPSAQHTPRSSSDLSALNLDSPPSLPSLPSSPDPQSDSRDLSRLPPPAHLHPRPPSRVPHPSLNLTNNPLNPKGSTSSSTLVNDEYNPSTRRANKPHSAPGSRPLNQYPPSHVISAFEIPEGAIPNQVVLDFWAEHDKDQHSSFIARMSEKKLFERSGVPPPALPSKSPTPPPSESEPTPSTSAESHQHDPDPPPDHQRPADFEDTSPDEHERTRPLLRNTRPQTGDQDRLRHLMSVERMPPRPPHPYRRPALSPKAISGLDTRLGNPSSELDTDTDTLSSQGAGDLSEHSEPVKEPGKTRLNAIFDDILSQDDFKLLTQKPASKQTPIDEPPRATAPKLKSIAPLAHLRGKVDLSTSTSVRNPTPEALHDDTRSVPSSQTSQAKLILNTELEDIAQTISRIHRAESDPTLRRIRSATQVDKGTCNPPPELTAPPCSNPSAPDEPVSEPSGAEPSSSDVSESEEPTLVRKPRAQIAANKPTVGPAAHPGGSTQSGPARNADALAPAASSSKPATTGSKRPGWHARPFLTPNGSTSEAENSADEQVDKTVRPGRMADQLTRSPVGRGLRKAVKKVTFSAAHLDEEARAAHKPRHPPTLPIELPPSALASSTPPQSRTMPGLVSPKRHTPFYNPRDSTLCGASSKFDPDPNSTTSTPRIAGDYPRTPVTTLNLRPGATRRDSERLLHRFKNIPAIRPTPTSLKALEDEPDEERPREPLAGSSTAAARRAGGTLQTQHNHDQDLGQAGVGQEPTDTRPPLSLKGKEKEVVSSTRFPLRADRATEASGHTSRPGDPSIDTRTLPGIGSGAGLQDKADETLVNSDQTRLSSTLTPHPPGWLGSTPSSQPVEPSPDHRWDAASQPKSSKDRSRKSGISRRPLPVPRSGTQHTPSIPANPPPTADYRAPSSSLTVPSSSNGQQHAPLAPPEALSHRPSSRSSTRPQSLPSATAPYCIPQDDMPRTIRPISQRAVMSAHAKQGDTQPIDEGPSQTWTSPSFSGFDQPERRLMSTPAGHAPNERGAQWHNTKPRRPPRGGGLENVLTDLTGAVEGLEEARNPIEALADTSSFMSLTNDSSVGTVSPQPNTGPVGMEDLVRSSNQVGMDRAKLESQLAKTGGRAGGQKRSRWKTVGRTAGAVAVHVLVAWLVLNLVTIRVYNKVLESDPGQHGTFQVGTVSGGGVLVELGWFIVDWLSGFPDARGRAWGNLHGELKAEEIIGGGWWWWWKWWWWWWRDVKELVWDDGCSWSGGDWNIEKFIGRCLTENFVPS